METKNVTLERIKAALISIAIGAGISIITVLFQELLGWLKEVQPAVPGVLAGYLTFLTKWRLGHFV